MSDGFYLIITCDRCGFEERITKSKADLMTSRLPRDWGFASYAAGKADETDLCPKCLEEYRILVENFMKGGRP